MKRFVFVNYCFSISNVLEGDASQEDCKPISSSLSFPFDKIYFYLQPVPPHGSAGSQEMHPVVVRDLLAPPDGLAGHQHHPVPLPVLDGVGVAAVVEEGNAGIQGTPHGLHGESLVLYDGLHHGVDVELENLEQLIMLLKNSIKT